MRAADPLPHLVEVIGDTENLNTILGAGRSPKGTNQWRGIPFSSEPIMARALFALALTSVATGIGSAQSQTPLAQQVEALSNAAFQARDAVMGYESRSDTPIRYGVAVRRELIGCAAGWSGLSLWRVTPDTHRSGDASVAVVREALYPLKGLESSELSGMVDALLQGGRTDGEPVTVDCLVETIAFMLALPEQDISRIPTVTAGGSVPPVRTELDDRLPRDWPSPVVLRSGGNTVVRFTVFYLYHFPAELLYYPVAYALVFDPRLKLLSWAERKGDPVPAR